MKPPISSWDNVERSIRNLELFLGRLEDQVFWVRRGPATSLDNTAEGQKLRKQFKRLHDAIATAASSAEHWRAVAEAPERLPGGGAGFRQEEGLKMFELYKTDFAEATSTSILRGNKWKQTDLTDLMDEILEMLRVDAKKILDQPEEETREQEEPTYRDFDLYGMKIIVDDASLGGAKTRDYIKYLDEAHALLSSKGFKDAWYGTAIIQCKSCGGVNKYGPELGVGGHYRIGPDTIGIFSRPGKFIVELMAHELGHRYWYKSMRPAQRAKFEQLVKIKGTEKEPGYPDLTKTDVDDVAELAKSKYKSLESALREFREQYPSMKVDRFDNYEDSINAFKNLSNAIYGFSGGNPIRKLIWDRFSGPPTVRYGEPGERRDRREQLEALLKHYFASTYELANFKLFDDWGKFIKKKNEDEVLRNTSGLERLVDKVGKDMGDLIRQLYKFVRESPQVQPVSDYGGVDISEAFAEAFTHYVLEKDMDRDQLESFRSVIKTAGDAHARSVALMKFLSKATKQLGVAEHVYVVGGAVRNWALNQPIKDIDIVIDSIGAKKDSEWLAKKLQHAIPVQTNLTTNQYGVAILTIKGEWQLDGHDMKGEVIEIANARKESYGGEAGKGYKPHMVEPATIEEDLSRREFTFNTLLWRLLDLEHGPDRAEVLDLLGVGKKHLEEKELRTPVDPDKTFSDDPTRMLRAIKFTAKYGFRIPADVAASIRRNAPKLKQMPWDAVRKILVGDILEGPAPRESIKLMHDLGLGHVLGEMLHEEPGFASALARSLTDKEIHLVLDLLDLGWTMRTPVSFLDPAGLTRLRVILLEEAENPDFERAFMQALLKPPVDQQRLFADLDIPPKSRGVVTQVARQKLLEHPELAQDPKALEEAVERQLGALGYSRTKIAFSTTHR